MKIINGIWSVLGRILGFLFTVILSAIAGWIFGWCWLFIDEEEGDIAREMINAHPYSNYQIVEK